MDITMLAQRLLSTSELLALLAIVVVLVLSLIYCRKRNVPPYMRRLPFYFFASSLSEVVAESFPGVAIYIFWGFAVFENIYFFYFFRFLNGVFGQLPMRAYAVVSILPSFIVFMASRQPTDSVIGAVIFGSFTIVTLCIMYFRTLMVYPPTLAPERDPAFWMVTGITFYFLIRLPVFWFTPYFYTVRRQLLGDAVYSIQKFALVISYILFIKAMTCLKNCTC